MRPLDPLEGLLNDSEEAGSFGRQSESSSGRSEAFQFRQADISQPEEVKSMVEAAAQFLGGCIHVVINNAGGILKALCSPSVRDCDRTSGGDCGLSVLPLWACQFWIRQL